MAGEERLREVAEIIMGQSPPGETYNERGEGLPFFQGVADFNYRYPTPRIFCSAPSRIAESGDILLSVRAPIGRVNVADRKCAIGRGLSIIRAKRSNDSRYLEFALRFLEGTWEAIEGSGSVFGNATRHDLEELPLPWPERRTDREAIAHILGTLDDKIELNRRMSETLEAMARALFKAWFVDFDPVRAKMEGRWHRGDLFPARLVDSVLGEIPEGWEVGTLSDVAELLRDQVNPLDSPDTRFRHFSIPAFDEGQWPKEELGEAIKSQKTRVAPGVVLLAKLNPQIERVWLVDVKPEDQAVCSTEFLVLRPRPPAGRAFVYCLARSPSFRQEIEGLVTGTSKSHQRAQAASVLSVRVVRAPQQTTRAYERQADLLLTRSVECRRESRTLAALRDALLPRLISGELRLGDAEKFIGRVM
jgi:type I restriction enzyme S subunit